MPTVTACSYGAQASVDTIYTYYISGDQYHLRMADYLVGAASRFNVRSESALAIGTQEAGGTGNNWMQLTAAYGIPPFQTYWAANNGTGQPTPTASQVEAIDSVNAAAGVYYFATRSNCGHADWQGLQSRHTYYNGDCSACACPKPTAYAWSCLFLAFGNNYSAISSSAYAGALYPTGPSGTQTRYSNTGCPPGTSLTVPTFAVTSFPQHTPIGRNSSGHQIILLATDDVDYVSSLQVNVNLYPTAYRQTMVTSDATFAAWCTQDNSVVVLCVGGPAVTAITTAASGLGLSVTSYATFSAWQSGSTRGYVNCAGANRLATYNAANTQTSAASAAGW